MSKEWILHIDCMGNCYFIAENGVRSQDFAWAQPYDENGIALVQLKNGMYAYRDLDGHFSYPYLKAYCYSNGFGVVQLRDKKWAFRDVDGNLSEKYKSARDYSDGFALVQKNNGKYAFRDVNGNLSEEYMYAWDYCNGFAEVKTLDGRYFYRDVNGNLLTELMLKYNNNKIDESKFSDEDFADEKFLDIVIKRTKDITSQSIDLAENDEQLEASRDYYNDTMEYVLSKAYDVKVQKEELERQQKERELFATKKKKLLEELNLVD